MEVDLENDFPASGNEDLDVLSYVEKRNTQKGMKWALRIWKTWQADKNAEADREVMIPSLYGLMSLPLNEIDTLLALFIKALRRTSGEEYTFNTVSSITFGIQRYARALATMHKKAPLIFNGNWNSFPKFNRAVGDKRVNFCIGNHGSSRKYAKGISLAQEQALWDKNILGLHSAKAMSNTIFFYVTKIFGFISGHGLRVMKTDHFTFSSDEYGKYVELDVNAIKDKFHDLVFYRCHGIEVLHTGKLRQYCDPTNPRTFYHLLKQYIQAINKSLQSAVACTGNSLFLAPKKGMQFSNQSIGKNSLQIKLRTIMTASNMSGHYHNLSLVQSIATRLQAKGYNLRRQRVYGALDHIEICKILDPPPGLLTTGDGQCQTKAILQLVAIPQQRLGRLQHILPTTSNNTPIYLASLNQNVAPPVPIHAPSTVVSSHMSVTQGHQGVDQTLVEQKRENMYGHTVYDDRVHPVALISGVTSNSVPLIQSTTRSTTTETQTKPSTQLKLSTVSCQSHTEQSNNNSLSDPIYKLREKTRSHALHVMSCALASPQKTYDYGAMREITRSHAMHTMACALESPQKTYNYGAICERNLEQAYPLSLSKTNNATEVDVNELLPHVSIKQEPSDSAEYEKKPELPYQSEQIQNETGQKHDNMQETLEANYKRNFDCGDCFADIEISNVRSRADETGDASSTVDKHGKTAEIEYAFSNDMGRQSIKQEVCVIDNDQTLFSFSSINKMGKTISDLDLNLGDYLPDDCVLKPGNVTLKRVVTPDGGKLVIHVKYET